MIDVCPLDLYTHTHTCKGSYTGQKPLLLASDKQTSFCRAWKSFCTGTLPPRPGGAVRGLLPVSHTGKWPDPCKASLEPWVGGVVSPAELPAY